MISSEVQRTLVKSPPELWAEISDPASLARHLGEFGEIRITRVEPEQRVEWEADDASGSVVIKPSGWGTKVKLTVTRELLQLDEQPQIEEEHEQPGSMEDALVEPELVEPEPVEPELVEPELVEPELVEPEMAEPEEVEHEQIEPELDAWQPAQPEPAATPPPPQPRRGFFARLFGRRLTAPPVEPTTGLGDEGEADARADLEIDPPQTTLDAPAAAPAPAPERYNALAVWASQIEPDGRDDDVWEPEQNAVAEDAPSPALAWPHDASQTPGVDLGERDEDAADDAEAPLDMSAEIAAAEEVAAEQVAAVLTGVLDRLGAAHHRPFSRS
jgi:hypothetical protein